MTAADPDAGFDAEVQAQFEAELAGLEAELVGAASPEPSPESSAPGPAPGCVAAVLRGPVDARPGDWRRPPDTRPAPGGRPPRRWDRGSATAELAVGLPVLTVFLLAAVLAVNAVSVKVQCVSAAREGALSAARGESGEAAARRVAPDGASVSVSVDGERAVATVSARVGSIGRFFGAVTVEATSSAAVEPGLP